MNIETVDGSVVIVDHIDLKIFQTRKWFCYIQHINNLDSLNSRMLNKLLTILFKDIQKIATDIGDV